MAVAAAVGGVVFAVAALAAPAALRWGTVAVLVALLAATWLLSAHAGAPVHAVKARGLRLEVWSEVDTVPDTFAFDIEEDQP